MNLAQLQARQAEINARQKAILTEAEKATSGALTAEQRTEFDKLEDEYASNETSIAALQADAERASRIAGRQLTRVTLPTLTGRTGDISGDGSGVVKVIAPAKFASLADAFAGLHGSASWRVPSHRPQSRRCNVGTSPSPGCRRRGR